MVAKDKKSDKTKKVYNYTEKPGRPTTYSPEIAKEICDKIASNGCGLIQLCKQNPHWPVPSTIYLWLTLYKDFSERYVLAKKFQVEVMVDEILYIADNTDQDIIIKIDKNGEEYETVNHEHIARSKLKVDTRKWLASKLVPKVYGDRAEPQSNTNDRDEVDKIRDELIDAKRR